MLFVEFIESKLNLNELPRKQHFGALFKTLTGDFMKTSTLLAALLLCGTSFAKASDIENVNCTLSVGAMSAQMKEQVVGSHLELQAEINGIKARVTDGVDERFIFASIGASGATIFRPTKVIAGAASASILSIDDARVSCEAK